MSDEPNIVAWRDRPLWHRLLIMVLGAAALGVWVAWLRPWSKYGAIAAVAAAVAANTAWELHKHRRGRATREGMWEQVILGALIGTALISVSLGRPAAQCYGASVVALFAWYLVIGYRARRRRQEAYETRHVARRASLRLLGSSHEEPATDTDGQSRAFYAFNDGEGAAFDVAIEYATSQGTETTRLAGLLEPDTASDSISLPPGCHELVLTYWSIPDHRFTQHWRFDKELGLVPSPHLSDGPRQMPEPL